MRNSFPKKNSTVAFFVASMRGGGAERVCLNLFPYIQSVEYEIDLILVNEEGPYLKELPDYINIVRPVRLTKKHFRTLSMIPWLIFYLLNKRPLVLYSHLTRNNIIASIVNVILFWTKTKFVLVEHNTLSMSLNNGGVTDKVIPWAIKYLYPFCDALVAVSEGVASDLHRVTKVSLEKITVIYNPIDLNLIQTKSIEPFDYHDFSVTKPYIIAVGRLNYQKNFSLLIDSFQIVCQKNNSISLLILGEGPDRSSLEERIRLAGLDNRVFMPGFVSNPYKYIRGANLLAMSSRWEGLPMVLLEALACGTSIVSTDCPSGPREILHSGDFGKLIAPDTNPEEFAKAILETNQFPMPPNLLKKRAKNFSVEIAAQKYLELVEK